MPHNLRLLVITRHSPLPENDGAGAYLHDVISYLARRGVRIEVAWFQPPGEWIRRGWCRVPANVHRVCSLRMPGAFALGHWRFFWFGALQAQLFHAIKTVLRFGRPARPKFAAPPTTPPPAPGPASWAALPSPAELRFVAKRSARFSPTDVLANYCWLTPCLEHVRHFTTCVLAHDVISERLARFHPELCAHPEAVVPATAAGERLLLAKAGLVVAISAEDALFFRERLGHPNVLVVPKAAFPASTPGPTLAPAAQRCLFVGGANEPNRLGLAWFLSAVWPLVRTAQPLATVHIVGPICDTVTDAPPGVILRGRLPDVGPEYHAAEVVIVPLLAGTGVKIKLVEAASYGKACVTTSVGLQGLAFLRPAVACADDAMTFALLLNEVLSDAKMRTALATAAREAIAAHLSPEACYGPLLQCLAGRYERLAN